MASLGNLLQIMAGRSIEGRRGNKKMLKVEEEPAPALHGLVVCATGSQVVSGYPAVTGRHQKLSSKKCHDQICISETSF